MKKLIFKIIILGIILNLWSNRLNDERIIKFRYAYNLYNYELIQVLRKTPIPISEYIVYYSKTYGIPINIVYGIIKKESNFKYMQSLRKNRDGSIDYGLMGINSKNINSDKFRKEFMDDNDVYCKDNHAMNIKIGVRYYKYLYTRLKNHKLALIAYNCGIGNLLKNNIPKKSIEYANYILSIEILNEKHGSCDESSKPYMLKYFNNIKLVYIQNDERRKIIKILEDLIFEYMGSV